MPKEKYNSSRENATYQLGLNIHLDQLRDETLLKVAREYYAEQCQKRGIKEFSTNLDTCSLSGLVKLSAAVMS